MKTFPWQERENDPVHQAGFLGAIRPLPVHSPAFLGISRPSRRRLATMMTIYPVTFVIMTIYPVTFVIMTIYPVTFVITFVIKRYQWHIC